MVCETVTFESSQNARKKAENLLQSVMNQLNGSYIFKTKLVGSAKYNTIMKDVNGMYDLDYQVILEPGVGFENSPTQIRNDFFNAFNKSLQLGDTISGSKSAITVKCKSNSLFSIDYVIIRDTDAEGQIIRRNDNDLNQYTWNKLPSRNASAYDKFGSLSESDQNSLRAKIIKRKCDAKRHGTGESSYHIFIEEVNNHRP